MAKEEDNYETDALDGLPDVSQIMRLPLNRLKSSMQWPRKIAPWRRALFVVLHQGCLYVMVMMALAGFEGMLFFDHMENVVSFCIMTCCQLKSVELLCNISKIEDTEKLLKSEMPEKERLILRKAAPMNAKTEKMTRTVTNIATSAFYPVIFPTVLVPLYGFFSQPCDERKTMGMTPTYVRENDIFFLISAAENCVVFAAALLFNASFDSIVVSLMLHIKCKCKILIEMLKITKMNPAEEQSICYQVLQLNSSDIIQKHEALLKFCIQYHQLILRLHRNSVGMCRYSIAYLCVYLSFCVIMPGIGLLVIDQIGVGRLVFTSALGVHGFMEITLFCFAAEELLRVTEQVMLAAYDAYDPELTVTNDSRACLRLMLMCSQRPLRYMAGGVIPLQRSTFMTICKRTYSIYSAFYNFT